jgi:hypothetical protein
MPTADGDRQRRHEATDTVAGHLEAVEQAKELKVWGWGSPAPGKRRLPKGGLEGWLGPHQRRGDGAGPAITGGGEAKILGFGWVGAVVGHT